MEENIVKFDIPIYGGQFWVCFSDDFIKTGNEIGVELKLSENNCSGLSVIKPDYETGLFLMFLKNNKIRPDIIAHESLHIANHIFNQRGVDAGPDNDEHQAYLMDWVVEKTFAAAYDLKKDIILRLEDGDIRLLYPKLKNIR